LVNKMTGQEFDGKDPISDKGRNFALRPQDWPRDVSGTYPQDSWEFFLFLQGGKSAGSKTWSFIYNRR
jgi:hypothetical protein